MSSRTRGGRSPTVDAHDARGNAARPRRRRSTLPSALQRTRSTSFVPGSVRGSPPDVGSRNMSSVHSPYAATQSPSGEMGFRAKPYAFPVIARGFPAGMSRTYNMRFLPASVAATSRRFPSGKNDVFATASKAPRSTEIDAPVPVGCRTRVFGESGGRTSTHLPSGDRSEASPGPRLTAGEPSVLRR